MLLSLRRAYTSQIATVEPWRKLPFWPERDVKGHDLVSFPTWRRLSANLRNESQSFAAGITAICLAHGRDWQGVIGPLIHGESKSQATRSSSDHMGLHDTLSTVDTLESKLRVLNRKEGRWIGRLACWPWSGLADGLVHRNMKVGIADVYRYCPLLTSDGWTDGPLRLHLEVWNYHVAVESGEIDHRLQISCLLWNQEQPAVVPEGCHVGDPLYGPLQQQGIHGLLEVLPAVSSPEADALMGELRSLLECYAHPVLDNARGPVVAQQTPPVQGKVCQASPHLGPVNAVWLRKLQKTCQTSSTGASTKGRLLCHCSLGRDGSRRPQTVEDWCPWRSLPGRRRFRAWLSLTVLLGEHDWRPSHPVRLSDGSDYVLKFLGLWT